MTELNDPAADCTSCPRDCHVARAQGELGYCQTGGDFSVGSICIHRGEEPVIGGTKGICNIFFTRCNLQCVYCQNYQISRNSGEIIEHRLSLAETVSRVNRILDTGVSSVGFVSPSHVIPQVKAIIRALSSELTAKARRMQGTKFSGAQPSSVVAVNSEAIPAVSSSATSAPQRFSSSSRPTFIFNTNAYDKVETIRSLEGMLDVYLPDLKYMSRDLAARFSGAPNYPEAATTAIKEMYRQKGAEILLDDEGVIRSGLIIRHLVLPGQVEDSKRCLRWIAEQLSPSVHVSVLAQYKATPLVADDPELGRPLRKDEYAAVLDELESLGFKNGWTQELSSSDSYAPDFARTHPFER